MKYRLIRYIPQKIEIEVLPAQIISMFPIEIQHHPFFGMLKRVWKVEEVEYSVEGFEQDEVEVVVPNKHTKLKEEVMLKILHHIDKFQIILYYSDKQDVYEVVKV